MPTSKYRVYYHYHKSGNLRMSQWGPVHWVELWQMHSKGWRWQVPSRQPGRGRHWSHRTPSHPISHEQRFGSVHEPWSQPKYSPLNSSQNWQIGTLQSLPGSDHPSRQMTRPLLSQIYWLLFWKCSFLCTELNGIRRSIPNYLCIHVKVGLINQWSVNRVKFFNYDNRVVK